MKRDKQMTFGTAMIIIAIMAAALSLGLLFMSLGTIAVFAIVVSAVVGLA